MNPGRLPELPSDLKSLETDFAALAPASGNLNRDELMYRAGWEACAVATARQSKPRGLPWLWSLSTAALVVVAVTLGIMLATREPEVQLVYVEKPPTPSAEAEKQKTAAADSIAAVRQPRLPSERALGRPARMGNDYFSLRERVLAFGVDVLPDSSAEPLPNGSPAVGDSRYGALIGQLRGG